MFAVHNAGLTDGALDEFQMVYKEIDTDGDGFVSVEEMGSYNRRLLGEGAEVVESIVIDNGSDEMKAGFGADEAPRTRFRSVFGTPLDLSSNLKDIYYGEDAVAYGAGVLDMKSPIDIYGRFTNRDDITTLWNNVFYEQLHIPPKENPVILTQKAASPSFRNDRSQIARIMFESFETPSLYVAIDAVLAVYASGRTTGIAVDSGKGITQIVPVYNGLAILDAVISVELAGSDVTTYMMDILQGSGLSFTTTRERETVRDMKETLGYVAIDFDQEAVVEKQYTLPDGTLVTIGDEQFRAPEIMFQPSLAGKNIEGIHRLTYNSIMKCHVDIREELYKNIVLTGGNTMFKGIAARMKKEMTALAPSSMKITIVAPPERKYSVWIGGSLLTSMQDFKGRCVSKMEYRKDGSDAIFQKTYDGATTVQTIHAWDAQSPTELTVGAGVSLIQLQPDNGGWTELYNPMNNEKGHIPTNRLKILWEGTPVGTKTEEESQLSGGLNVMLFLAFVALSAVIGFYFGRKKLGRKDQYKILAVGEEKKEVGIELPSYQNL